MVVPMRGRANTGVSSAQENPILLKMLEELLRQPLEGVDI
jgi:hypothetical protein